MGWTLKHILHHKSGRVSYRRRYPKPLARFVADSSGFLKVSLGDPKASDFLARYLAAEERYSKIVETAQRKAHGAFDTVDDLMLARLGAHISHDILAGDEMERYSVERDELFASVMADLKSRNVDFASAFSDDQGNRWSQKKIAGIEGAIAHCKGLKGRGDVRGMIDYWREDLELICESEGLVLDLTEQVDLARICRNLNDAGLSAWEQVLQRFAGESVETPAEPVAVEVKPVRRAEHQNKSVPLLELYDEYASSVGVKPNTRTEGRRHVEKLCLFAGVRDALELSEDHIFDWRDALGAEVTAKGKLRDPLTVRKYISTISACLNWAVQERRLRQNVAKDVVVHIRKKAVLRDRDYTFSEAEKILSASLLPIDDDIAVSAKRARRWVPWLCAYTGARVNELGQLRAEDIRAYEGVWCIRITPEAGTVKTDIARIVPIHDHLLAQGFVEMAQAQGSGPLFYDRSLQRSENSDGRHYKKVGERLAKWIRTDVGITDEGVKPNHAWRHMFKTLCARYGIEEGMADYIQGHAPKTTGRTYGKKDVRSMADALRKFEPFNVG